MNGSCRSEAFTDASKFALQHFRCVLCPLVYRRALRSRTKIHAHVQIQDWQQRNESAREADQRLLYEKLNDLEANIDGLAEVLGTYSNAHCSRMKIESTLISDERHGSMLAMMASLQRRLDSLVEGERERRFLICSLAYLQRASGEQVELEDWTITAFDVEFGKKIGSGSL
jgi:hypothetical protein